VSVYLLTPVVVSDALKIKLMRELHPAANKICGMP
jgi:hypothetical protein